MKARGRDEPQTNKPKSTAKTSLSPNNKQKEILSLQKQLIKKVYSDLFQSNPAFYQEKNLTYENFLYYFYNDTISTFDYTKDTSSYDQLLLELEAKVMKKLPSSSAISSMTPLQQKRLALQHKQSDDWGIVSQYQAKLHQEESKRQLEKIAESLRDYYQSITKQIEDKKRFEKEKEEKKQKELQAKRDREREALHKTQLSIKQHIEQLMKNEECLSHENKAKFKEKLSREAIVNQSLQSLLEENSKITNESKGIIEYKLGIIAIDQKKALMNKEGYHQGEMEISKVVDEIMKQKSEQGLYQTMNKIYEDEGVVTRKKIKPQIDLDLEERVNKIMQSKMKGNLIK